MRTLTLEPSVAEALPNRPVIRKTPRIKCTVYDGLITEEILPNTEYLSNIVKGRKLRYS